MANIQDKDSGVSVKVSDQNSMFVTFGDDGLPSFFTKIWHPRLTSSLGANTCLWAIRAPSTRTLIIRGGQINLSVDTTPATITEVSIDMVRFTTADPTGGTVLIPARLRTSDPDPQTTVIRGASATSGLSLVGANIDPTTTSFFALSVPAVAGSVTSTELDTSSGLELGEGEGLAIYIRGGGAPLGFQITGLLQFSERV